MNNVQWFSARLRLLILVENTGTVRVEDCVHVFRSHDWEPAFKRALQLGRSHEREFKNDAGERVRRQLHSIVTLDLIQSDDLDGAEVNSESSDPSVELQLPFGTVFTPDRSEPAQSI
jgi:hypothetical protein